MFKTDTVSIREGRLEPLREFQRVRRFADDGSDGPVADVARKGWRVGCMEGDDDFGHFRIVLVVLSLVSWLWRGWYGGSGWVFVELGLSRVWNIFVECSLL